MNELTTAEVADLIETTYSRHGEGFLACFCGRERVYISELGVGNRTKLFRLVRHTIEHARTRHSVPYEVVFTPRPVVVMEPDR